MSSEAFPPPPGAKATHLFALASRQHGAVTSAQLLALGYSRTTIERMRARAQIRPIVRGVWEIGHARGDLAAQHAAALLTAGRGAYLFRRSAALQLGLPVKAPDVPEVGIPPGRTVRHEAITTFRSATIDRSLDVRKVGGMPTTAVARTLVDLAGVLSKPDLVRVCEQAAFRRLLHDDEVIDCMRRARNAKGSKDLRSILAQEGLEGSSFEREVIDALVAAGAPAPSLQQEFRMPDNGPFRVDLCWHDERLAVEVDGPHHAHPVFARKDRERDEALAARGYRVLRITATAWRAARAREIRRVLAEL